MRGELSGLCFGRLTHSECGRQSVGEDGRSGTWSHWKRPRKGNVCWLSALSETYQVPLHDDSFYSLHKSGKEKKKQWNKAFSYVGMSNSLKNETLMFYAIGVPLNHVITASKESKLWSCPSSSGGPAAFYLTDIFSYLLHTTFPTILISTYWYLSSKRQLTGRNSALWSNNSHTREEGK